MICNLGVNKRALGWIVAFLFFLVLLNLVYPPGGQLRWLEIENSTEMALLVEVNGISTKELLEPKSRTTLREKVFRGGSLQCRFFDRKGKFVKEIYLFGRDLNRIDDTETLRVHL